MKKIKFRVWDKIDQCFAYGVIGGKDAFFKITAEKDLDMLRYHTNKAPIDLFIGRKDKEEKDIYGRDIVEINHPYKNRNWKGPIEWFGYYWGGKGFYFTHFDDPGNLFAEGTEYIKIIGNIYENPDLLKEVI